MLTATVQENVLSQLEHLRIQPAVASALARQAVRLHGWVYKIETGDVSSYDPTEGQFLPAVDVKLSALPTLRRAGAPVI